MGLIDRIIEASQPLRVTTYNVRTCFQNIEKIASVVRDVLQRQATHQIMIQEIWKNQQAIMAKLTDDSVVQLPDINLPSDSDKKESCKKPN